MEKKSKPLQPSQHATRIGVCWIIVAFASCTWLHVTFAITDKREDCTSIHPDVQSYTAGQVA